MNECKTGKISYCTAKEAKAVINHQKSNAKRSYHAPCTKSYLCEMCGYYHLSSKTRGQVKRNNKIKERSTAKMMFISKLKDNPTVSWYLKNTVKWIELNIISDNVVHANYIHNGIGKRVFLRNI